MTKGRFIYFFCFFLGILQSVVAQRESFPKGYFQFPIHPGQKNTLAGVLGDLRTNHFHAGIDIRTQQREGLQVLAAAEGYISRIKVQTSGYGNVIFIKHPNGMTTVYGHLLSFAEPMGSYLRQKQYERKSFEIELNPSPDQFPVSKGQLIGLSGNTGGSAGPHLHFEIRDSKDNYLNPLFFDFAEIEDNTPPYFTSMAIRPMSLLSRINGEFERITFRPVRQKEGFYSVAQPIKAWGEIGLELIAFDAMTGVNFRNGVNCVEIKLDGQEVFAYNMTSFPSWSTRDYNNLIDYATEQKTGARYLKCYNPDGNQFNVHKTDGYRGKLQIRDTLMHDVEVTLFDSYENSAVLRLKIKGEAPEELLPLLEEPEALPTVAYLKTDAVENVLKITAFGLSQLIEADIYVKNKSIKLAPAYRSSGETVYLLDLRDYLPDSIQIGNKQLKTNFRERIRPNIIETYNGDRYTLRFGNQSIFDTLYLAVQSRANGLVINEENIPLRDAIGVNFRPDVMPANPEKTHAYRFDGERLRFVGGKWQGEMLDFATRELGDFSIATDETPPSLRLIQSSKKSISARISDGMSGIGSFNAFVNGEWVLMNYDYKRNYIWSDKLVDTLDFEGELRLEVTDRAGNIAILQAEIKEPVVKPATRKKHGTASRRKSSPVRSKGSKRKRR
ncbi:M23 family metallopeptidase [Runella aurantiaca]|uniref:M23 family peptidase n=1 Tax=Runella aurantiaca TaxID=2282308 RepID=A0A369I9C6_9BACT|nr:M23 family metallopeptidase [Runella aurantiaca]RDB05490.1 M23 family peptidase [Runella aurantiaca]